MQTLTYGRKRPDNLDRGSVFFDALRDNVARDDAHNHDGVNAPKLNTDAINRYEVAVTSSGWTALGDGRFKKTVTMPGSFIWGQTIIKAYGGTGSLWPDREIVGARFVKVSPTTFDVILFANNQPLTLKFN